MHQALVYSSTDEFLSATLPFTRQGLRVGEPVLVVSHRANVEALRETLGDQAGRVDFRDAGEWYSSPTHALRSWNRYLDVHAPRGRVRGIGELPWHDRSAAATREQVRYESVLNLAFAGAPAQIICPYDASKLSDDVIDHAFRTHPEVVGTGWTDKSSTYTDPRLLSTMLDFTELESPALGRRELSFAHDLSDVRSFVAAQAADAGIGAGRMAEVVLVVNELATNAVGHGGGRGTLKTWTEPNAFVCEVSDTGGGLGDPLAGYFQPAAGEPPGVGLWLSRQLSGLVEVRATSNGTTVRVRVPL